MDGGGGNAHCLSYNGLKGGDEQIAVKDGYAQ